MEVGAHVWLRSKSSQWGWVPAVLVKKTETKEKGRDVTNLTFQDESEGHYDKIEPFEETLAIDTLALQSSEIDDVKMRNMDADDAKGGGYEGISSPGKPLVKKKTSTVVGGVDDLIGLMHLHEPAILHSLRIRYDKDIIYTGTGPILIAINPFKAMPKLYSKEGMESYRMQGEGIQERPGLTRKKSLMQVGVRMSARAHDDDRKKLPPHVYQTADDAYRAMMRGIEDQIIMSPRKRKDGDSDPDPTDQSILVSGESGAGKTVTTKICLNYFAVLSRRKAQSLNENMPGTPESGGNRTKTTSPGVVASGVEDRASIEQQVLQSNPILEAFGNARTIRNDNSSRFGKFIEVRFTTKGQLCGGSVETYLLEKIRLLKPSNGERNYHVFYQLLSSATDQERSDFRLDQLFFEDFKLLSHSGTYDRRDGVLDSDNHEEMIEAMDTMNFPDDAQHSLMRLVAAILFLGNMTFLPNQADHGESCTLQRDAASINSAFLLGVTFDALDKALTTRIINAAGETLVKPLNAQQASKACEALIKAVYGAAFDWIVMLINESIDVQDGSSRSLNAQGAFIGVLDIFGFEVFDYNNYEQLCINYTNETLQQQFNKYVFKLEQQEYEREGILWKFIPFPDNQDVIDLIDKRRVGILAIVDEQCMIPKATDENMYRYILKGCEKHSRFKASHGQKPRFKFSVEHYAGHVEYSTENWLEKNRDELPRASSDLLASSNFNLIHDIRAFVRSESTKGRRGVGSVISVSVGGQFSRQLTQLRARIDATSPHYIRCLKPNDELVPDYFDPRNIVEQLRYGGVLEAVRVSRAGYPTRYTHDVFIGRYYILGHNLNQKKKVRMTQGEELRKLVEDITLDVWTADNRLLESVKHTNETLANGNSNKGRKSFLSRGNSKKNVTSKPKPRSTLALGIPLPETKEEFLNLDYGSRCAVAGFQVGKTKVFLRREAFDRIEGMRTRRFYDGATIIQTRMRRHLAMNHYAEQKRACLKMQTIARMIVAKNILKGKRRRSAAIKIQSIARRNSAIQYVKVFRFTTCRLILRLQRQFRKRKFERMALEDASKITVVQTAFRGYLARVQLKRAKTGIGKMQAMTRGVLARKYVIAQRRKQAKAEQQRKARLKAEQDARRKVEAERQAEQERINATAAKLKALENARLELWRNIEAQNWALVEHILDQTPEIAQAVDPKTGELPLHSIARHPNAWTLLIDMCIVSYPKALVHRDSMGALPIHHAAAHDCTEAMEILWHAYKDGVSDLDNKGRLPIHVAAEFDAVNCIKFLLEKHPEGAYTSIHRPAAMSGGGLPLHVACRHGASIGCMTALLAENFAAAKKTDENGDLPLHLILRNGAEVEVVIIKTLLTCFSTAVSRVDVNEDLPLTIALKHGCKPGIFSLLLLQFPSAAQVLDKDEHSALFLALAHGADDRTILSLLNHAPEYATAVDRQTGLLPIQVATENEHSPLVVLNLLKLDMPIDLKEKVRAQLLPHHYSWNHILSNTDDIYHSVISKILQQCTQPQVLALAHVEGPPPDNKIALASATPVCKHEIRVMLRLFHTLEIVNQRPAYTNVLSDTQIFYALRYDPPAHLSNLQFTLLHEDAGESKMQGGMEDLDNLTLNDDATVQSGVSMRSQRSAISLRSQHSVDEKLRQIHKERGQQVIAKLTSRSDVVERELRIRRDYRLSRNYIPIILSVHHTVQHAAYSEAMAEPGYCITMEGADATAENYMLDLRNAGVEFPVKALKKIGIALLHMHERGLVHGDFGTHNIGKFRKKWKLLGVGCSYKVGDSTDPKRGFYHPPESIILEKSSSKGGMFRVGSNKNKTTGAFVSSIRADATFDIWAFGVVLYEAMVGAPISPYMCRGKRAMSTEEFAKLGKWSDSKLQKALSQLSEANRERDAREVRDVKDLLAKILHHDPRKRIQTMRKVLEHPFFGSSSSMQREMSQAGTESQPVATRLSNDFHQERSTRNGR